MLWQVLWMTGWRMASHRAGGQLQAARPAVLQTCSVCSACHFLKWTQNLQKSENQGTSRPSLRNHSSSPSGTSLSNRPALQRLASAAWRELGAEVRQKHVPEKIRIRPEQMRAREDGESIFMASCVGEHLECSPCGKLAVSCVSTLG